MSPQLRDACLEGIAGARGFIEEQQEDGLVGQVAMRLAVLETALQVGRHAQQSL